MTMMRNHGVRWARRLGAAVAALVLGGCSTVRPVAAWEKGDLARPTMQFEGDRLEMAFQEHTYASKEGNAGGTAVGGGGCGCN